jgi:hypothetical protein
MSGAIARWLPAFVIWLALVGALPAAEILRAKVQLGEVWLGQRVPVVIELLSPTIFSGVPTFDWPEIAGMTVIEAGHPIVSSETIEGQPFNVQRHEFAVFTQAAGEVVIPPFAVRFARRDETGGGSVEVKGQTPELRFRAKRPPGSERLGYVITTDDFTVEESWNPQPGPVAVGAVFKRTITQHAKDVAGMALAPASSDAPPGVRVYPGRPAVNDDLERGDFSGERSETVTYLCESPGSFTLPAQSFAWWNSTSAELQTKTLPAVTFEVRGVAKNRTEQLPETRATVLWIGVALLAVLGLGWWQRGRLRAAARHFHARLHDPERETSTRLGKACAADDAAAAYGALQDWLRVCRARGLGATVEADLRSRAGRPLRAEWSALQQRLYGTTAVGPWDGAPLARAFTAARLRLCVGDHSAAAHSRSSLPPLNP